MTVPRVLRHPDFRNLFLGQAASAVGDQVVIVALALYITARTGSATDLGIVLLAQTLPLVLLLLFGACRAFFQPAYSGLVPQTAPEEMMQEARALSASSQNLAILVGPALGTVLVLGLGAGEAFALDAAAGARCARGPGCG